MNFLELVNRTRVECGVSGPTLTTLSNLTGESARIKDWVNEAWMDIQRAKEDWFFMRQPLQFNTVAQQRFYTPAQAGVSSFSNWKRDSFRASTVGSNYGDEQLLNYMDFLIYRNLYWYANMRNTYQRPVVVTIDPQKNLGFGAAPDQAYVIVGEYYTNPELMVDDTDTPGLLPDRFHMAIVYRAMIYYAGYESAPEVFSRGQSEFNRIMARIDIDQLPTMISGAPLA